MRVPIALLVLILADVAGLAAQRPSNTARLIAVLSDADSGTVFRIRSSTGTQVEGLLTYLDSAQVALGSSRPLLLAEIDRAWQRGTAWRTGALIGTPTGLVVGTWGGLVVGMGSYGSEQTAYAVAGAVAGAAVGFGLGAGIGALFPKWRRRYP